MSTEIDRPTPEFRMSLFLLHEQFSQSSYGKTLAGAVRYERYKPSDVSHKQWEALLGPDVNNLRHLVFTHELAIDFIKAQAYSASPFTQPESEKLELAAITHDWGESLVGDVTFEAKTVEDEMKEEVAMKQIAELIVKPHQSPTAPQITEAFSMIVLGGDTRLARAFNAIERLGYLTTGLRAWHKSSEVDTDVRDHLHWLANNVLLNQVPTLTRYVDEYPAIGMYLAEQTGLITEVFNHMPAASFNKYGSTDESSQVIKWNEAKAIWHQKISHE